MSKFFAAIPGGPRKIVMFFFPWQGEWPRNSSANLRSAWLQDGWMGWLAQIRLSRNWKGGSVWTPAIALFFHHSIGVSIGFSRDNDALCFYGLLDHYRTLLDIFLQLGLGK